MLDGLKRIHRPQIESGKKPKNSGVRVAIIILTELTVASASDRKQLVRNSGPVERLLQSHDVAVGNHIVSITVYCDDWRIAFGERGKIRGSARDIFLLRRTAEPFHRIILKIVTPEQVANVRCSIPVDDGSYGRIGITFIFGTGPDGRGIEGRSGGIISAFRLTKSLLIIGVAMSRFSVVAIERLRRSSLLIELAAKRESQLPNQRSNRVRGKRQS
jgi:hypothetical protein